MEAVGAASACLALLGTSLNILDRAKGALHRTKNGTEYLDSVTTDIKATLNVVKLIEVEPELRKDHIMFHMLDAVTQVQSRATRFTNTLEKLDQGCKTDNGLREFAKHFIKGNREQKDMEKMKNDINDSKSTLILALVTAQVGLLGIDRQRKDVTIDMMAVNRVDELMKGCSDVKQGLRIMELLKVRGRNEEDGYHLQDEDLDELDKTPPYVRPGETTITTTGNVAEDSGFVIGGPIGKDGGNKFSMFIPNHQITKGNKAVRGGFVVGGGMQPWLAQDLYQASIKGNSPPTQPQ